MIINTSYEIKKIFSFLNFLESSAFLKNVRKTQINFLFTIIVINDDFFQGFISSDKLL